MYKRVKLYNISWRISDIYFVCQFDKLVCRRDLNEVKLDWHVIVNSHVHSQ